MVEIHMMSVLLGMAASTLFLLLVSYFFQWRAVRARSEAAEALRQAHEDIAQDKQVAHQQLEDELTVLREAAYQEIDRAREDLNTLRTSFQEREKDLQGRESDLHEQQIQLHKRDSLVSEQLEKAYDFQRLNNKKHSELVEKLEKVSHLSANAAREELIENLKNEVEIERRQWIVKVEEETKMQAKARATDILVGAMQRNLSEMVTANTASSVALPSEDMCGRIIGKEGRNIRSLEMSTGMEFILDENARTITVSGFNPLRKEIALRALNVLMSDGRINPTRIEEVVDECEKEIGTVIVEKGNDAALTLSIPNVHPEVIKLLGKLHFRTSYSQNVLAHSIEVAQFARSIASELGLDANLAARCGLFHDIGKAVSAEMEGPHAQIGADLAREYGECEIVVNAIAAHHNEVPIKTVYDVITQIADACSASRPGARRETLTTYVKRLEELEKITQTFPGVRKAYALQAGREVRVIVDDTAVDDGQVIILARNIVKKIESEINFPGQIKVSVIRETRAVEYAK